LQKSHLFLPAVYRCVRFFTTLYQQLIQHHDIETHRAHEGKAFIAVRCSIGSLFYLTASHIPLAHLSYKASVCNT